MLEIIECKLMKEFRGKVLAVGVPTVVDAATIANDTIDMVLDDLIGKVESGKDFYSMLQRWIKMKNKCL